MRASVKHLACVHYHSNPSWFGMGNGSKQTNSNNETFSKKSLTLTFIICSYHPKNPKESNDMRASVKRLFWQVCITIQIYHVCHDIVHGRTISGKMYIFLFCGVLLKRRYVMVQCTCHENGDPLILNTSLLVKSGQFFSYQVNWGCVNCCFSWQLTATVVV